MQIVKYSAAKKKFAAMLPVKKRLSMQEACSYLDMSRNTLMDLVTEGHFSVATVGAKKYFSVKEMDDFLESQVTIKKTTP